METSDTAILGASALWIQGDTIASVYQRTHLWQVGLQAVYHWHILSMTNQETVHGIVPYPLVGQEHHLRCKDQLTHQVKV